MDINFLYEQRGGILVLIFIIFSFAVLTNYLMWVLGWGRFKIDPGVEPTKKREKLNFVVANAAIKLVNDFRHLLALVLVGVFGGVLWYSLYQSNGVGEIKDALQTVMATLGGLVGSIIGYYFGESSVRTAANLNNSSNTQVNSTVNQQPVQSDSIEEARQPEE
jgi:type IV secretory pathway VirB6-like protein